MNPILCHHIATRKMLDTLLVCVLFPAMKTIRHILAVSILATAPLVASDAAVKVNPPTAAPAAEGKDQDGKVVKFADLYKANKYVLVYFYPKADTPGCTKQGCSLRDGYEQLTKQGVAVIGVSHDNAADQKAFKDKFHFPFTLIADTDSAVREAFGVPTYPATSVNKRQAYLIKDGKIIYTDYKGTTDKQAATILEVLAAQKS